MFDDVLIEQNPHWTGVEYPSGVERDCFPKMRSYLSLPHVISVTGVRRAGKSTLLKQLINSLIKEDGINPKNILFSNLEHPYFVRYAQNVEYLEKLFEDYLKITDPKGKIYCFFDEIQFFDKWPVFIKAHFEQKNIKFVITGSNSFLMSHELLTLLSGRTMPIEVFPLSFGELIKAKLDIVNHSPIVLSKQRNRIRQQLDEFIHYGGFPEVVLREKDEISFEILNTYSKTILFQDVASRLKLKKPLDLEQLYYYLASHIGVLFSYSNLSKLFEISDKTTKEYVGALEDTNLLFELNKFSFSLKHQFRGAKKIYSIDTGMVNAISFKFSENRGRLFENIVFLELKRRGNEIYYYKTNQDYEVDFVVRSGRKISLVQVCLELSNDGAISREVRAVVHAAQELGVKEGTIVTADEEKEFLIDGVTIQEIPLYKFLCL